MSNSQQSTQSERKSGEACSLEGGRRTQIKLPQTPPQIMICCPIGSKWEQLHLPIPSCQDKKCKCKNHDRWVHTQVYNQGLVPAEWAVNIANVVIPLNTTVGYLFEKGRLSADARNRMTERAIELNAKYIFYWDDDVILHPHALYTMHNILETNEDIGLVTGVYCTRETPTEPMIYREHGRGAWWKFSTAMEAPPEDIFSCGGGCLMVRVEDIKKMKPPYWCDEQVVHEHGQTMWGHDVRFVKKFRDESGKRTVVKGSILCGHWDTAKQKMFEFPQEKGDGSASVKRDKPRTASNRSRNRKLRDSQSGESNADKPAKDRHRRRSSKAT